MQGDFHTTIKNREIRIAILYTEHYPLGSDSFYQQYVAPFQNSIGSNLQSCDWSGLYSGITTDQDITGALTTLFDTAVLSVQPHLSN